MWMAFYALGAVFGLLSFVSFVLLIKNIVKKEDKPKGKYIAGWLIFAVLAGATIHLATAVFGPNVNAMDNDPEFADFDDEDDDLAFDDEDDDDF